MPKSAKKKQKQPPEPLCALAAHRLFLDARRRAFAQNEERRGRLDAELLCVVAFVDGDADAAPRIDVQERLTDGHVHEGFYVREQKLLFVDLQWHLFAEFVAELLEIIRGNVRDQRAERIVEGDDIAGDALFVGRRDLRRKANQLRNDGADEIEFPSGGQMRGGGRENVASMEG